MPPPVFKSLVRGEGLEPSQPCGQQPLKLSRLPFRHPRDNPAFYLLKQPKRSPLARDDSTLKVVSKADGKAIRRVEPLPELDARRTSQAHIIHMVVRIYTRRSKRQLIRFGGPLPEKPIRAKRIIKNIIYEGLQIQAYINNGPGRITWAKARKELNISEAKLAHLLKIVKTIPPDFVENMESCTDESMLKIFHGRQLLKISRLKTEKERQNAIEHLLPKT